MKILWKMRFDRQLTLPQPGGWGADPLCRWKSSYNLYSALCIQGSSMYPVPYPWIQPTVDCVALYIYYWKKNLHLNEPMQVQTHIVQGSMHIETTSNT